MALIQCPECQHNISDSALASPSCGYKLKDSLSDGFARQVRFILRVAIIAVWSLAAFFAIWFILALCFNLW